MDKGHRTSINQKIEGNLPTSLKLLYLLWGLLKHETERFLAGKVKIIIVSKGDAQN